MRTVSAVEMVGLKKINCSSPKGKQYSRVEWFTADTSIFHSGVPDSTPDYYVFSIQFLMIHPAGCR